MQLPSNSGRPINLHKKKVHKVKNATKRKNVTASIVRAIWTRVRNFGSSISGGATAGKHKGLLFLILRQAKINKYRLISFVINLPHHYVLRFNISMHNMIFMQHGYGNEYFPEDTLQLLLRFNQPHL